MQTKHNENVFRGCALKRPEINIRPMNGGIGEIDCRELRWWGIVPLSGERSVMAIYDLPDWHLTSVTELTVTGSGSVHGVKCAVISQKEWERSEKSESGWRMDRLRVMGRLTDDCAQWLAMITDYDGGGDGMAVTTFLDETFQAGFPDMPRRMADEGNYSETQSGVITVKGLPTDRQVTWGAGTFDVAVGNSTSRCLRVFECRLSECSMLIEAYLDSTGRTLLVRRYNGFNWQVKESGETWDHRLKGQPVIHINGVSFIHWYDCVFKVP